MKSIDINTIVSNDAIESISSRFDDNITLTKLTKKINCNHLVVIDKTIQRLLFKYFIHYSEDELIVFEIKKEKKRRFIFKESNFSGVFVYNYDSEIMSTDLSIN